jgi:GDP-mannose 6-dehydrogenase
VNISIFGLGYVGCVGLGCIAKNGHNVIGVDVNSNKVDFINSGKCPIIEKDIDKIIEEQHKNGRIRATTDHYDAVVNSDVSFICVGTPSSATGHLDMNYIWNVAEQIGGALKDKQGFHVIAVRSTVFPGTVKKISKIIEDTSNKKADEHFCVISNPEFLREGCAVSDFYNPPFLLIGSSNEYGTNRLKLVYEGLTAPIVVTDIQTAELTKHVNNAFHALKVTFANEIGHICKKLGQDSQKLMKIFCMDTKLNISDHYLKSGFAYGGSCLPKDLKALKTIAHDLYIECPIIEHIDKSNELVKLLVLKQITEFNKQKIAFLGLSFKAGTDDLRESPVIDIIEKLVGKGCIIYIYDKNIHLSKLCGVNREYILSKIPYISNFITCEHECIVKNAEVVIVVNNDPDHVEILNMLHRDTIVYDFVNVDFEMRPFMKNYEGIAW